MVKKIINIIFLTFYRIVIQFGYMKYKAVIFDLFGTLIGDIFGPPAMEVRVNMATALSIPLDDFNQKWSESYYAPGSRCHLDRRNA